MLLTEAGKDKEAIEQFQAAAKNGDFGCKVKFVTASEAGEAQNILLGELGVEVKNLPMMMAVKHDKESKTPFTFRYKFDKDVALMKESDVVTFAKGMIDNKLPKYFKS